MADEHEFFSPVLRQEALDACGKCNACRQACRVHAITVTTSGATVDRAKCFDVVKKDGGECFDCLLACRHGVLALRRFRQESAGSFVQLT